MSQTFSIKCQETKKAVLVGQSAMGGFPFRFYSFDKDAMFALGAFLSEHRGKPLIFGDDEHDTEDGYSEYVPPTNDDDDERGEHYPG